MPAFVKTLNNIETDENMPAEFAVQVQGDQEPHVEWSHNGQLVKEGPNHLVNFLFES